MSQEKPKLQQSDPVFQKTYVPLTATQYYDYFSNFILGTKIETSITYSSDCIDSVVYTIDDGSYFLNNFTTTTRKNFIGPVLNASSLLGGNFSECPYNCYMAGDNLYQATSQKLQSFSGNYANILTAFLFNLMGNSLKLRQAFQNIQNDLINGYYVDIALQYGKIVYLVVSFSVADINSAVSGPSNTKQ